MVYNNGFPETYQNGYPQNNFPGYSYGFQAPQYGQPQYQQVTQMAQQPIQQNQNNQQQNNSTIIWVQGEAGAKAYPLAPNNKILLMDSENPVLYVKSVNASGIPDPLIVYDLVQRSEEQQVQKSESDARLNSIEERLKKIENRLQNNVNNSKQRRERNDG